MDDIEYEGTVKWELQLVDHIYQKTNSRDFAGGESILDWFVNLQVKKKMTILSFVVS